MEMFRTPVQSPWPPPLLAASCAVTANGTLYRICKKSSGLCQGQATLSVTGDIIRFDSYSERDTQEGEQDERHGLDFLAGGDSVLHVAVEVLERPVADQRGRGHGDTHEHVARHPHESRAHLPAHRLDAEGAES
jgi:hypothetical protein